MKKYKNQDVSRIIEEDVHSERNRIILKRKLIDGISYKNLASEVDMSERGIRYIVSSFKEEYGLR